MTSPFNTSHHAPTDDGRLTLVNGRCFSITDRNGSISRPTDGTVFEDTRMLSHFAVRITNGCGDVSQRLAVSQPAPFHHAIVTRPDPSSCEGESTETYVHRRWVGRGVRHDIEIHNAAGQEIVRTVTIELDTDFAHIFDMKSGVGSGRTSLFTWGHGIGALVDPDDPALRVDITTVPEADVVADGKAVSWTVVCGPRSATTVAIGFEPAWDGEPAGMLFPLELEPAHATPARRHERWRRDVPQVRTTDRRLAETVETSLADLASLRIFDPEHPERTVVAAGAPWFMTLFGRDSLLTSWMSLPFAPELARGVLHALAELQGTTNRPENEEQPGKIIHELRRRGGGDAFAERGRYYGTVDATPLFVMVAAEAHRWGHLDGHEVAGLWPSVAAALGWVRRSIAADPTGFLRYQRSTPSGLLNQGWKDSWDGVTFADGRIPSGAIALSEVQGYAYAALHAGAELASVVASAADRGDAGGGVDIDVDADVLIGEAEQLRHRFEQAFWVESASSYALGVTADGDHIDAVTTNPGHAIWCRIADTDRAGRYFERVMDESELWSGWGLRTLSPRCGAYNPLSYHNGSVWPHDTALVAAGAAAIGRFDVVDRVADAALDVASHRDGRPPELFAGISRSVVDTPVDYPDSCSPQAWSSASTLLNIRSVLGLEPPPEPSGRPVTTRSSGLPVLEMGSLHGLRVGRRSVDITVAGGAVMIGDATSPLT